MSTQKKVPLNPICETKRKHAELIYADKQQLMFVARESLKFLRRLVRKSYPPPQQDIPWNVLTQMGPRHALRCTWFTQDDSEALAR